MAEISQLEADAEGIIIASLPRRCGIVMILLGGGGLFLHRKLVTGDGSQDEDEVLGTYLLPVKIGANVRNNPPAFDKEAAFQQPPETPPGLTTSRSPKPERIGHRRLFISFGFISFTNSATSGDFQWQSK